MALTNIKGMADALAAARQLMASPEWQKYAAQGRVQFTPNQYSSAKHALQGIQAQLNAMKAQDQQVANYYELATGQKADESVLAKYSSYASDPALLQAAISKGAASQGPIGTYKDTITQSVQTALGRDATPAEIEFFGKQMEQGNIDAYGLNDFLKGTEEYQTNYLTKARQGLTSEMGAIDEAYLGKVGQSLQSKYAEAGRPGAGAFGAEMIEAGKDLARERSGYMANLGYEAAKQGTGTLTSQYQQNLSNMYNQQQGRTSLGSESRNRYYSQQDRAAQAAQQRELLKYQQQLQSQNNPTFLQGLVPGLINAGASLYGAYLGKPSGVSGTDKTIYSYNKKLNY